MNLIDLSCILCASLSISREYIFTYATQTSNQHTARAVELIAARHFVHLTMHRDRLHMI